MTFDWTVVWVSLLIILARVGDVTLGTLRTVAVIYGRKYSAWILGFFEVTVWLFVAARVIESVLDEPIYGFAYAAGFATGNFIGISIEQVVAFGEQVVRIFTRRGDEVVAALREEGFRVSEFDGRGRDGPVALLFIQTPRKQTRKLLERARNIDPSCYYVIDDVRSASMPLVENVAAQPVRSGSHWRSQLKRK